MIAVDTNILVYAHREELGLHEVARERLRSLAEGAARWAIPVTVVGEFLRVITHRRIFDPPHTVAEACEALQRVLRSPNLTVLNPGQHYPVLLFEAMKEASAAGNLVFDAQIVALCREHGVARLLTQDRDFSRFGEFSVERLDG